MKETRIIAFGIILLILTSSILLSVCHSQFPQTESPTMVEKAVDFLLSQFNPTIGLCREATNTASNTYWLVSDNLWAYKALELASESALSNAAEAATTAQTIKTNLTKLAVQYDLPTDSTGLPISYAHEAVIGGVALPPYKTTTNCTLYVSDYVLNTTMLDGTSMLDWQNYADLLLYASLSNHWKGNYSAALAFYNNASNMWNGTAVGFQDAVANGTGLYSSYKLVLFLYASKLLGESPYFESELVDKIYAQQRESDGGILTDYFANARATCLDSDHFYTCNFNSFSKRDFQTH